MKCISPPALTHEALSLALDDLADAPTQRHLAECAWCKSRLESMKRMDTTLQGHLRRFDCPPAQRLTDFHMGMLEASEADAVQQHVTSCSRCQAELAALTSFLNNPASTESNDPMPDNIIPMPVYKPSARRGSRAIQVDTSGNLALQLRGGASDDEKAHDQASGSARLYLESKVLADGFLLTGQILDSQVDWRDGIAEIWQDERLQQVSVLDEMCEFSFKLENASSATLIVTAANGSSLRVENLSFQT